MLPKIRVPEATSAADDPLLAQKTIHVTIPMTIDAPASSHHASRSWSDIQIVPTFVSPLSVSYASMPQLFSFIGRNGTFAKYFIAFYQRGCNESDAID